MPASVWAPLLATAIAALAWRARSLTRSGAVAAAFVGTVALAAGASWGAYLIGWFAVASLLSRLGRRVKEARLAGLVEKPGAREAAQVLANGVIFAACAVGHLVSGGALWAVAGAGALAAAGADTWGTEVGTLLRGDAWSLLSGSRVPAGTSGAITLPGTAASFAGAGALAALGWSVGLIPGGAVVAVAIGGAGGAVVDTLLGAWAQERRWCDSCEEPTEARRHRCGTASRVVGGVPGVRNDLVNLFATLAGAGIAVACAG